MLTCWIGYSSTLSCHLLIVESDLARKFTLLCQLHRPKCVLTSIDSTHPPTSHWVSHSPTTSPAAPASPLSEQIPRLDATLPWHFWTPTASSQTNTVSPASLSAIPSSANTARSLSSSIGFVMGWKICQQGVQCGIDRKRDRVLILQSAVWWYGLFFGKFVHFCCFSVA